MNKSKLQLFNERLKKAELPTYQEHRKEFEYTCWGGSFESMWELAMKKALPIIEAQQSELEIKRRAENE